MKLLVLAANGQVARIVIQRILAEPAFADVQLTLELRNHERLAELATNDRVTVAEVDLEDAASVAAVMAGQDMVYIGVVDHDDNNAITKNVVAAMKAAGVSRLISTSLLGLYNEVPGEFGRWNSERVGGAMAGAIKADQLLENSGVTYTTLRLPWLNDRDEVKYVLTHRHDQYIGVSGSRQSVADVVLRIVADPTFGRMIV
ncbi:saccharopine dehydrogenase [Furfurilactobacillus sp. OKN36]